MKDFFGAIGSIRGSGVGRSWCRLAYGGASDELYATLAMPERGAISVTVRAGVGSAPPEVCVKWIRYANSGPEEDMVLLEGLPQ